MEFILTDRSLIMMLDDLPSLDAEGNIYRARFSRTDMDEIFKRGLVQWEASAKACYFLTEDQALVVVPSGELGATIPEYGIPFKTKGLRPDRMVYFSGVLLIVPDETRILVMSGGVDLKARFVRLPEAGGGSGFYQSGGKLFFGKNGDGRIEISVDGEKVRAIKKEKR